MRSKVRLFAAIRHDARVEGLSIRALADKYRVHRRTVRQALASAIPPARQRGSPPATPVLDTVRDLIDAMLVADLTAPRKQRHTAKRIFQRLCDEHGARVCYSTVVKYVHRRRPEIIERERSRLSVLEGFVPQEHAPADEAEVDFGEVMVRLDGTLTQCYLFAFRLSYSGKSVHRVYRTQSQESFLDGHVEAFETLDGVPAGRIRYDNLKAAVARVCFGRTRVESDRWIMFRSHYQFEAFYCRPGIEGAHEKGGVEGEVGRFRRRWFVPVPKAASLSELNRRLADADAAEDARHIDERFSTVGADFAREAPLLARLPDEPFDTTLALHARVDRYSRVLVRRCYYSVPAALIGSRVLVRLGALELHVWHAGRLVATHPRLAEPGAARLVLDHYLEILAGKPGALAGSKPLAQARADGSFTSLHEAFWAAAVARVGQRDGTRALIEVLLLHRRLPRTSVLAGIAAALRAGSINPEVVAIEARKAATATSQGQTSNMDDALPGSAPRVLTLGRGPGRDLPADTRPTPSMAAYDQLLPRRARNAS